MQKFQRYFAAFQDAYAGMKTTIAEATPEKAEKFGRVLEKLTGAMAEEWRHGD